MYGRTRPATSDLHRRRIWPLSGRPGRAGALRDNGPQREAGESRALAAPHIDLRRLRGMISGATSWDGGMADERITINGIDLEVLRRGPKGAGGTPVLLLHGMDTVPPNAPFLDLLGQHAEIIAPSSP